MAENGNLFHEKFDRKENVKLGSEKSFGLTFATVLFLIGMLPVLFQHPPRTWAIALGVLFILISILKPAIFRVPNRIWFKFGLLLNRIISPLILALLFYFVFTPMGLALRLFKKDILNLKINKSLSTYWIESESQIGSMKDQF